MPFEQLLLDKTTTYQHIGTDLIYTKEFDRDELIERSWCKMVRPSKTKGSRSRGRLCASDTVAPAGIFASPG
jgi:hypothetical protein